MALTPDAPEDEARQTPSDDAARTTGASPIDDVMDSELPRYAEALERLGR